MVVLLTTACLATVGACVSPVPRPGPAALEAARSDEPEATLDRLRRGRRAYVVNCSGCHALFLPREYPDDRWSHWVDEMAERSNLTAEETRLIRLYLRAVNDIPPASKGSEAPDAPGPNGRTEG